MSGGEDLIQKVTLEDEASAGLEKIGETGASAFGQLGTAAQQAAEHLGSIEAAAKRLHTTYEEMAEKVAAASAAVAGQGTATASAAAGVQEHAGAVGSLDQALNKLTSSLGQVGGGFGQLLSGIQSAAEHMLGLESAMGKLAFRAIEVVGALGLVAQHAANSAQALIHSADAIGLSTKEYEKLQYVAGQTGTKMGSVTRALREIETSTEKAIASGYNSSGKFAKQNIILADSAGKAREPLEVLRDAFKHAADSGNVAADLMQTFNKRTGGELTQWAKLGADGVEKLTQRFEKLHLHTSDETLEDGRKLYSEFENVSAAAGSLGEKFGLALAPAFTPAMAALADTLGALTPIVSGLGQALGGVLRVALEGVILPLQAISVAANVVGSVFGQIAEGAQKAGAAVQDYNSKQLVAEKQAGLRGPATKDEDAVGGFPWLIKKAKEYNQSLYDIEKSAGLHLGQETTKEIKKVGTATIEAKATSAEAQKKEENYAHAVNNVVKAERNRNQGAEDSARAVAKAYRSQDETIEDVNRSIFRAQRAEQEGAEDVERNIFRTERAADETIEDQNRNLEKSQKNLEKLTNKGPDFSAADAAAKSGTETSEALGAQIDAIDTGSPFGQQTKKSIAASKKKEALEEAKAKAEQKAAVQEQKAREEAEEKYREQKERADEALEDQERGAFRAIRGAGESVEDAKREGFRTLRGLREAREDTERSGARSIRNAGEGVTDAERARDRSSEKLEEALQSAREHLEKASEQLPGSKGGQRNINAAVAKTGEAAALGLGQVAKDAKEAAEALAELGQEAKDQTFGEGGTGDEEAGGGGGWGMGFAAGTDNVPSTGPALIHAGEMIIPAGPAGALRALMSMAGSSLDFPTMGARSVVSASAAPAGPQSMGTVHLNLGEGGSHAVLAPAAVFRSIHSYAMRRQVTSAGRSQSAVR